MNTLDFMKGRRMAEKPKSKEAWRIEAAGRIAVTNEAIRQVHRLENMEELADRLGYKSSSTLTMWEKPHYQRKPGGYALYRYYVAFHVPPEWIVTGERRRLERDLDEKIKELEDKDKKPGKF